MAGGFDRILVPTDFTPCAEAAWATAQRLARALGAELTLVHVVSESGLLGGAPFAGGLAAEARTEAAKEAEGRLAAWAAAASGAGLVARTDLRAGAPHEQIVEAATAAGADLIVVGTHGGMRRAVLGSVADRVIRLAPCPVVAVREPS